MKAKKTNSPSKLVGPRKAVQWRSSEVFHLRSMLAHVQSKLDRIHVLGPRLAAEAPEMQVSDLITRLRKRKKELIKKISEEDKKILNKRPESGGIFKDGKYHVEYYLPPLEGTEKWLESRMDSWKYTPPYFFGAGCVEPAYFKKLSYRKLRLHHKSKASYQVWPVGPGQYADFWFRAKLNDDAAWYRDDNPDSASWGSETAYFIPAPDRDAIVHLSFWVYLSCNFVNAADDGGRLCHSVSMEHTDPDGHWSGLYSEVESSQVVFIQEKKTDNYSHWRTFRLAFETKRDISPAVCVLFLTNLSAQDGKVDTAGRWIASPELHYFFSEP